MHKARRLLVPYTVRFSTPFRPLRRRIPQFSFPASSGGTAGTQPQQPAQTSSPPQPPVPTTIPGAAIVPAPQPAPVVPPPPPAIQEFQREWLEAEFGHKVIIAGTTQPQLVAEVKAFVSTGRTAASSVKEFLERHSSTSTLPRTNEGKAEKVVSVILGQ